MPAAQLKFVLSCITSSLLFFFFGDTSGLNDFIIFFFLTPANTQRLPVSLSSLTSPWKHHIALPGGVRQLGALACASKVGIETSTSFRSENNEEAPS